MDIIQLYSDFSVDFVTEGHKHTQSGWVNVECPFCTGNAGYHLGYNLEENYYHCWRCGGKNLVKTLSKILNLSEDKTEQVIKEYGYISSRSESAKKVVIGTHPFKFPSGTGELSPAHRKYLEGRNFDPDKLVKLWDLKSTGPLSKLETKEKIFDYKNRILIPYSWEGKVVSFDTRSTVNHESDELRYKACPKEFETISHKAILYGKQESWGKTGICVEGTTDVWRFGESAFAVSGIKYTPEQTICIAKIFKRVAVCFDDDWQAKLSAVTLAAELRFRGLDAFMVKIEGDPASMKQEEADYFVKQLIG